MGNQIRLKPDPIDKALNKRDNFVKHKHRIPCIWVCGVGVWVVWWGVSPSFVCGTQIALWGAVQIIVFRQIACPTLKGSNMNSRSVAKRHRCLTKQNRC
jgi:hypothetical protein